jgi:biopolymer transport protein ExbB
MMNTYLERYVAEGGVMMLALVPTSILALGYIIQGFITLRRGRMLGSEAVRRACLDLARRDDREGLAKLLSEQKPTLFSSILRRGLLQDGRSASPGEEVNLAREEVARLFRRIHPLAVIFNVAPYMGILGTVIGLMQTFQAYAASGNPTIKQLSAGLDTALITTIWGLGIAIPSYIFHHLFRSKLIRYERTTCRKRWSRSSPTSASRIGGASRAPSGPSAPPRSHAPRRKKRVLTGSARTDHTEPGVTPRTRPRCRRRNGFGQTLLRRAQFRRSAVAVTGANRRVRF